MMGNKKLSEIRRELSELFAKLPGGPRVWFDREIRAAQGRAGRDVKALKVLLASAVPTPARKRGPRRRKTAGTRS